MVRRLTISFTKEVETCGDNSCLEKRPSSRLFWNRGLFDVDLWLRLWRFVDRPCLVDADDPRGAPGCLVDFDQGAAQPDFAGGHRERRRHVGNETVHDRVDCAA